MAVPDFQTLMRPLLEEYTGGNERLIAEVRAALAQRFSLTPDELAERLPSASWRLVLGLHELSLNDDRDKLPAGAWIVRLLVGADDGDAHQYDVHVAWSESRPDSQSALDEAIEHLAIASV